MFFIWRAVCLRTLRNKISQAERFVNMKKLLSVFLSALFVLSLLSVTAFAEAPQMELSAKSAVLIEPTTGKILFEQASRQTAPCQRYQNYDHAFGDGGIRQRPV